MSIIGTVTNIGTFVQKGSGRIRLKIVLILKYKQGNIGFEDSRHVNLAQSPFHIHEQNICKYNSSTLHRIYLKPTLVRKYIQIPSAILIWTVANFVSRSPSRLQPPPPLKKGVRQGCYCYCYCCIWFRYFIDQGLLLECMEGEGRLTFKVRCT